MIIAYLAESAIPSREANSVHVMKMCQAFAKQGHSVTLYARVGTEAVPDWHAHYGVSPTFDIVRCEQPQWGRMSRAVYGWRLARAVARRPRPDLLYGRDTFGLAASTRLGVPIVLEAHGLARGPLLRLLQRWLMRRPAFRRLVVISDALRRDYQRVFPWFSADQIVVAHDGADLPQEAEQLHVDNGTFHVGYLGHLYPGKGMEVIVPMAQRLPEIEFHVAGGTRDDLDRWKKETASISNLRLHGYIAPAQTEAFRQAMDVLLVPTQQRVGRAGGGSNHAAWISPLKLFESMASARSIVASDLPVLREVLTHDVNALLVSPEDIEGWVRAVRALQEDAQLRSRLANQAFKDVAKQFTWDARAKRVLSGVEEC